MAEKKKTRAEQIKEDARNLKLNPINVFTCGACKDVSGVPMAEFQKHLTEVHEIGKDQMKGNRQMVAHIDGDYWFSSSYEWTLVSGLKFSQYVRMAREKSMY